MGKKAFMPLSSGERKERTLRGRCADDDKGRTPFRQQETNTTKQKDVLPMPRKRSVTHFSTEIGEKDSEWNQRLQGEEKSLLLA